MTAREKLTIARILKVNHAGEYGAIRIYRAQLWIARRWVPDVAALLEEILEHEVTHCAAFRGAMPERAARPCRIMALWGNGGLVLGFLTALLGHRSIWICTAAVEAAVHRHLEDQLHFLRARDPMLHALILEIQKEELVHLNLAEERITAPTWYARTLGTVIAGTTEAVIWLSTWGDPEPAARAQARFGDTLEKLFG